MNKKELKRLEEIRRILLEEMVVETDLDKLNLLTIKERNISELIKSYEKKRVLSDSTINALIVSGTSLVSILLMLNFEKVDVFTSKAIGFLIKSRV